MASNKDRAIAAVEDASVLRLYLRRILQYINIEITVLVYLDMG